MAPPNEGSVHIDFPDIVDEYRYRTIGGAKQLIDRGRLARTQVAADEGDRHPPTVPR